MGNEIAPPLQQVAERMEKAIADVFVVDDVTLGIPHQPDTIRLRGRLLVPSEQAYARIAARWQEMGYTAVLRHDQETDLDVLLAMPGVMPRESGGRKWINVVLFVLTVLSTLFVGAFFSDQVPPSADEGWLLAHLWLGWPFALSLMAILTGHELGHYFAGRYYKIAVSLPYFIPLPVPPLGTMGAAILMKGRTVDRRQMLTVGAAGPLVGFVLAVPILLLGLSLSTIQPLSPPEPGTMIFMEGNSLLYLLFKYALFGQILPGSGVVESLPGGLSQVGAALLGTFPLDSGYDVTIHPVALAGWAGLLVTAFNLLPVGQLDGGHVLYSLIGQRARVLTWPVIGLLVLMGFFLWSGWYLWAALIFLFGQSHPDPLDDVTRLDTPRKLVAVAVLLIFLLTFTPLPLQIFMGELPASEVEQAANCLALPGLLVGAALWLARRARARARA
jgi:membrane-associated protease RseP (regulator of RpoE activity)